MTSLSWTSIAKRSGDFKGGRLDLRVGRSPQDSWQIERIRSFFGRGVVVTVRTTVGPMNITMTDANARVTKTRRGRVRLDYRHGRAYVALIPNWHPRATRAA